MAARTNSEKIEATQREILQQEHLLKQFQERYELEVGLLQSEVSELKKKVHALELQDPVQDNRLSNVEKLLDEGRTRRWQVWLAFLGAILSATVALIVAFAKR